MSVDPTRGVIRRMPLVASIDGTLLPSLSVEMLRVAQRRAGIARGVAGTSVGSVTVGHSAVPTEADGAVRAYFSPHLAERFVSAVDVLKGRVDVAALHERLVLIGLTGVACRSTRTHPSASACPAARSRPNCWRI